MMFDLQPTLHGDLVTLRPLAGEDFTALYSVAADPLVWEQHPDKTRHTEPGFMAFFREAMESGGALLAVDARTGKVIGSSRFHGYSRDASEVEIGWTFLARSHWGGKYNGEMKLLMLQHAFRFVDRVVFLIGPQNVRSQRAVEKIGAARMDARPDEHGREMVVYGILASEFAARKQGIPGNYLGIRGNEIL
jgi:RimJ/RimL family protein N-acetyltransferase